MFISSAYEPCVSHSTGKIFAFQVFCPDAFLAHSDNFGCRKCRKPMCKQIELLSPFSTFRGITPLFR